MEEEEEKEGKVEKGEVEREKFVEKVQKKIANNFMAERKEEDVEKKGRKSDRCPKARHACGKVWKIGSFYYCCWGRIGCVLMLQRKIHREGREC